MNFRFPTLLAALTFSVSATVQAECIEPKVPAKAPSGATASEAELIAAISEMKQLNADTTTYTNCIDSEADAKIAEGGSVLAADQIKKIKVEAAQKHNGSVDSLQKYADALNAQIKIFKARPAAKN